MDKWYDALHIVGNGQTVEQVYLPLWKRWPGQFIRFGMVGVLNTSLDLLILNGLFWLFPPKTTLLILLFNSIAYGLSGVNSFLLNKYWTFEQRRSITWGEVRRFMITTFLGVGCNDFLIWFANNLFHPLISNTTLLMNVSKCVAIAGTIFVSYLGMRLWVFAQRSPGVEAPGNKMSGSAIESRAILPGHRMVLGAIVLFAIVLRFFHLGQNGYGNLYYAAGVRSMADSWHNFFFASFDPGGFVSIDKPPFGFWLQVFSTKIFGFTPFSIFLPQAICGVLAVLLLYSLARRHFGIIAGLVAALALAVSPISVVTDRNNTIDGTLALTLLLAAWAVICACETGKLRWLLLGGVFVGIGFNIKMAQAYLVLPALGIAYLLCAPHMIWTRFWHLLLSIWVMLVISLSWAAVVDLTPASQRPYVGSTKNNSEVSLAFGYNGLNRLRLGEGGSHSHQADAGPSAGDNAKPHTRGRAFNVGAPGPFRLFNVSLGGQIAWMLPFALLAILALAWRRRFDFQRDRQHLGLVLWGVWVLTMAIFFSLDASFRQYYMTEMVPGLSALVGSGLVVMWQAYRGTGWRGWLLPVALVVTGATQISLLMSYYPAWSRWLSPLIGLLTALAVTVLIFFRLRSHLHLNISMFRAAGVAVSVGMFALLVAPAVWSGYSAIQNAGSTNPLAGPTAQGNSANAGGYGRIRWSSQVDPALLSYLEERQGHTKFLVATPSARMAAGIILSTNRPVMALGGFLGRDPILSTSDLQKLIENGAVRFFLIDSPRASQDRNSFVDRSGSFGQNALSRWVSNNCSAVPKQDWHASIMNAGADQVSGLLLYDCASF